MKAVYTKANPSGAFPPIQESSFSKIPEGMAEWPEEMDTTVFYDYNGFVNLTFADGKVTGCEPNTEAWERWKAEQPEQTEPRPESTAPSMEDVAEMMLDHEVRLVTLEMTGGERV